MNLITKVARRIGMDGAIAYSSSARIIQAAANFIVIASLLSPAEQGFYYTFGSIAGIQVFFELGFTGIKTQYVAHETVHLKLNESNTYDGPMYIQLGKVGEKIIHNEELNLKLGDIVPFKVENKKDAIIVTGSIASVIVASPEAEMADVFTLPFVKPINQGQITNIANTYETITVIEEHQKSSGVGSAVIEQISDLFYSGKVGKYPKVHRIAIEDYFQDVSGSQNYLRGRAGLRL